MNKVVALIEAELQRLVREGKISKESRQYVEGENLNLSRFSLLPKIHKTLTDVPGWPVISNCSTPTGRTSG